MSQLLTLYVYSSRYFIDLTHFIHFFQILNSLPLIAPPTYHFTEVYLLKSHFF